ncbi:LOW QUALITY PROTEIN: tripartite motif-containing protein 16 [Microcaecilia unicolor]|uniref:LOW QUALITY PROTEIN: tripartite motif-containing protein 16 n=1 Tax=Microcaecilia unicolor TaxID=1415580 RepID=A0A6P7YFV8_9AMPH|nr:LOW QUALITY PROTEIN: tripartite motif-containing protein 16 [Microcaecilia unicolor]
MADTETTSSLLPQPPSFEHAPAYATLSSEKRISFGNSQEQKGKGESSSECKPTSDPGSVRDSAPTVNGTGEGAGKANASELETTPQDATAADTSTEVLCDFCLQEKVRAVKSCLTCTVSYCQAHLKPHIENPKLQNHRLLEPVKDFDLQSCNTHGKHLAWFCQTDLKCICEDCVAEEHRQHETITCTKARRDKEIELLLTTEEYGRKLRSAENAIVKLQANTASIQNSVAEAKGAINAQFDVLLEAVKKAQAHVLEFIEEKERAAVNQSDGIRTHLEHKCTELKRSKDKMEDLAKHKNEIYFLQEYCAFKKSTGDDTLPSVYIGLKDKMSTIRDVVLESTKNLVRVLESSYKDKLQEFAKEEDYGIKTMVSAIVPAKYRISAPEPKTRTDFLKYICMLMLDPVTAHRFLRLLEDNRKVTNSSPWQHPYPDHPERFEHWRQVLCLESLYMGRFYFEVEIKGEDIHIGMTYKCIDRKGSESNSSITGNDFSWSLKWSGKEFSAWHSDVEIPLKADKFTRIGVYLNYPRGSLSFYGVADDTMILLHKFEHEFTEPLYAAFWLPKKENSVRIIDPDEEAEMPQSVAPTSSVHAMPVTTISSERSVTSSTSPTLTTEILVNTTVKTMKVETTIAQGQGSVTNGCLSPLSDSRKLVESLSILSNVSEKNNNIPSSGHTL